MSVAAALVCLPLVPFFPLPRPSAWPFIAASGVVHVIYNLLLVRQYRRGDFGHTYPVARGSSPLLIAVGGACFASEHPSPNVVAGICLVCAGILSLAFGARALFGSFLAAIATGVSIAVYSVIDALGARRSGNAVAYTLWMTLGYGAGLPILFWLVRRKIGSRYGHHDRSEILKAAAGGVVSVIAYGIVVWAMAHGAMGQVSALRETSALFAVILGSVFLKEKFTVQKVLAAALIVAGNFLMHG